MAGPESGVSGNLKRDSPWYGGLGNLKTQLLRVRFWLRSRLLHVRVNISTNTDEACFVAFIWAVPSLRTSLWRSTALI